jgi:hypothetical protein
MPYVRGQWRKSLFSMRLELVEALERSWGMSRVSAETRLPISDELRRQVMAVSGSPDEDQQL